MVIHKEIIVGTTALGTFSANTASFTGGKLANILVRPTSSANKYDIKIVDEDDYVIIEREEITGDYSDILEIPVRNIYTVTVTNATIDEIINIKLVLHES